MLMVIMAVAPGLLDLAEGLLGGREVTVLEGCGQRGERSVAIAATPQAAPGAVPRRSGLEVGKGLLRTRQVTCFQGLPQLLEQGLHLLEELSLGMLSLFRALVAMLPALRDLGEGLLGCDEVALLQGIGKGGEGPLWWVPIPLRVRCRGAKGGEGILGGLEISGLQGLPELVEEGLALGPVALLGGRSAGGDDTQIRHNPSLGSAGKGLRSHSWWWLPIGQVAPGVEENCRHTCWAESADHQTPVRLGV